MTTPINYIGKVPPKMIGGAVYKLVPQLAGGGGGGSPVTPVPVAVVLQGGTNGTAYSETISAQGGSGSGYVYALQSGSLPPSPSVTPSTGGMRRPPTARH